MKIVFKTDPELSFFHAAAVIALVGESIDPKTAKSLSAACSVINERLELAEVDIVGFWRGLVSQLTTDDAQRVETALLAADCPELGTDSLAPVILGRLADARLSYREAFPKLADQLPLRARPLKELWEAVGPGLLRLIGKKTVEAMIPARTTLHWVQPVRGGDGGLIDKTDAIWIEAMLTHPDSTIPETLRIAWLVARKGLDRMQGARDVEAERLPRAAALALLPTVLAAGEELDLCRLTATTIERAAALWHVDRDCDTLLRWWGQMEHTPLPLPVAIKALDKMLAE